jgi:hypothetical protein
MAFISFLSCLVLLFLLHRARLSDAGWCSTSVCWSDVHVVDIEKVEVELSSHSFHFFILVPLVLCYSSCTGLQVVEAAQNFCELLLVATVFHPVGLVLVISQLTYQHFCVPSFLHHFVVEGCPGLCGPWVPYPIFFLDEFHPGFSLALGVDFSLPPVDDLFSLWINLLKKGAFGLSGRLLHPSDLPGLLEVPPPGGPSYSGYSSFLPSCLNAMASVLTSSSASIRPFLVSVITALWSVAIPDASSFKGFPQMRSYPGNHGSPVKAYLLVLFHCFRVCALGNPVIVPAPILFLARCTPIISSHRICAWMRCTHSCPWAILLIFVLCPSVD